MGRHHYLYVRIFLSVDFLEPWAELIICMIVIPSASAALLACGAVYLAIQDYNLNKSTPTGQPGPKLTISSAAFTSDGRVLVDDSGMLPKQVVDLDGFSEVRMLS